MYITICKTDNQCKFNARSRGLKAGALDNTEGWGGRGRFRIGEVYAHLWLIHVDVCLGPPQSWKVIALQLK